MPVGLNHATVFDYIDAEIAKNNAVKKEIINFSNEELSSLIDNYKNKPYVQRALYHLFTLIDVPKSLRRYQVAKSMLEERTKS